jgi:hypothetical protein
MSAARSTIFYRGDTTTDLGGLQITGFGDSNPNSAQSLILTPTNNAGNTQDRPISLGGFGNFNSNTVGLNVSGNVGIGTTNAVDSITIDRLTGFGQLRFVYGGYGAFFRQDGTSFILLTTNQNDAYGSWNTLFPLSVSLATGVVNLNQGLKVGQQASINQPGDLGLSRNTDPGSGAIFFGNAGTAYISSNGSQWFINPPLPSAGLMIQHFNMDVGTQPRLNFSEGTGITLQVVNDTANSRVGVIIINATPSDIRLKQNVKELQGGLSIVNQIRLIEAEYNGLAGTTAGKKVTSVIAQDLESILPESVISVPTKLYGGDVSGTDVLRVNTDAILYHSVLAIQQLDARLSQLEKKRKS